MALVLFTSPGCGGEHEGCLLIVLHPSEDGEGGGVFSTCWALLLFLLEMQVCRAEPLRGRAQLQPKKNIYLIFTFIASSHHCTVMSFSTPVLTIMFSLQDKCGLRLISVFGITRY